MRLLCSFDNQATAERFAAYLVANNIPATAEASASHYSIWIEREEHLERAQAELAQFAADPANPRFNQVHQAAKILRQQQQLQQRRKANFIDFRTATSAGRQYATPATIVLITLCLIVAGLTMLGTKADPWLYRLQIEDLSTAQSEDPASLFRHVPGFLALITPYTEETPVRFLGSVRDGQVWRLFTPMLIHFGPMHLVFNLWWLYSLGRALEQRRGTPFFIALVLLIDLISSFGQYFIDGPNFGGMSGVVYGLFGYVWIKGLTDPLFGLRLDTQTVGIMLVWLVVCMIGVMGPVANTAHLLGLLIGVIWAGLPWLTRKLRRSLGSK